MYQDYAYSSMIGLLVMIIVPIILAFVGKYFSGYIPLILGNIASAFVSYYFVTQMSGVERWGGYFKPFTPFQFFIGSSVIDLIPQGLAVGLAIKKKKNR